jgi:glyoxylase-like metal-dependent hydrolase (beta-lactamase superfamily II)
VTSWVEVGDRVLVRRYPFFDQNIGAVIGDDGVLVVDTRSGPRQGREILDDLRSVTALPVTAVVDTHGHYDHAFGNSVFRPAEIWGHEGCVRFLDATGELQRASVMAEIAEIADEVREVVIDPPDRTFAESAVVEFGGRRVELRFLGRGHTDHDIVATVPDAGVVFAGDLLENGAVPYFGDGYPLDWPATVERLAELVTGDVVPGHGDHGGREFADGQLAALRSVVVLGGRVASGELTLDEALGLSPFPAYPAANLREPLERTVAQIRGEIG